MIPNTIYTVDVAKIALNKWIEDHRLVPGSKLPSDHYFQEGSPWLVHDSR